MTKRDIVKHSIRRNEILNSKICAARGFGASILRWGKMNIETVSVSQLVFDPANVRKHNAKNLEAIKGSLAKFGQQKPIVVDANNVVIAGNGTLEAAKSLGWEKIDIHRTHLTGAEAIAFALADNRTAELAEWDKEGLGSHLQGLREDGWELMDLGFDISDLESFGLGSLPDFTPGSEDDQGQLDENKKHVCPECGHEFET